MLDVFLSVLLVMSGIDLLLRKFVSKLFLISVLEGEERELKVKLVTAPLKSRALISNRRME